MFSVLCSCNWWLLHFAGPKTYSFSSPVDSTAAVAANLDKSILKVSIFMWNSFVLWYYFTWEMFTHCYANKLRSCIRLWCLSCLRFWVCLERYGKLVGQKNTCICLSNKRYVTCRAMKNCIWVCCAYEFFFLSEGKIQIFIWWSQW